MEAVWPGLFQLWSARWGDKPHQRSSAVAMTGRTSKRLKDREYYSPKKRFVRLVETGAFNAAHVHAEIFALSTEKRSLTALKLREMLHHWTPVWVNCGGFGQERGQSSVLVEALRSRSVSVRHARAIAEELVLNWGADVAASYGDGMKPLCVASARGFPEAVRFLLDLGCDASVKSTGTFMVKKKAFKGTHDAHEWAVVMYHGELAAGTAERELRNLKQCIELTKPKGSHSCSFCRG